MVSSHFEDVAIQPPCSLYTMASMIWTHSFYLKHTCKSGLNKAPMSLSICLMSWNKLSKFSHLIIDIECLFLYGGLFGQGWTSNLVLGLSVNPIVNPVIPTPMAWYRELACNDYIWCMDSDGINELEIYTNVVHSIIYMLSISLSKANHLTLDVKSQCCVILYVITWALTHLEE